MSADTTALSALAALVEQVAPGWTVDITNHDYITASGRKVITAVRESLYGGGPGFTDRAEKGRQEGYYAWPSEGDDFEVDGLTLRVYNPSHTYVGGRRAITLTMVFAPPAGR